MKKLLEFSEPDSPHARQSPRRHDCGDWGEELCTEDKQANEDALKYGTRLLSCYRTTSGDRLPIITEASRDGYLAPLGCLCGHVRPLVYRNSK